MVLFLPAREELVWVFQRSQDELSEGGILPVGHFERWMDLSDEVVPPFGLGFSDEEDKSGRQECKIGLFVIGVDVLDNHEWHSQFEQPGIEEGRHLQVLLSEERQNRIYLLHLSLTHTQLVFVAVVG